MMVLIMGGSGSGKSACGEEYLSHISPEGINYYLATMQVFHEEERKKVKAHRQLRKGKGFRTIEQPVDISLALKQMEEDKLKVDGEGFGKGVRQGRGILLECMSNLVANEMFTGKKLLSGRETVKKILGEIRQLQEESDHLVIVTNNLFEDGISYDQETMEYIRAMGSLNQSLAGMADEVVEVVVGIPIVLKGGSKNDHS